MSNEAIWSQVLRVARMKAGADNRPFLLKELVDGVFELDPSHNRGSIAPIIQGMTKNAPGGVQAACGEVLVRVGRGIYQLADGQQSSSPRESSSPEALSSPAALSDKVLDLLGRQPAMKAKEIARELNVTRNRINSLLYGVLSKSVRKADGHTWSIRFDAPSSDQARSPATPLQLDPGNGWFRVQ